MCAGRSRSSPPSRSPGLARAVTARLLDALVPCHCLHCFALEPGSMRLGLCSACRCRLEPVESADRVACELCGRALHGRRSRAFPLCLPCRGRSSPIDRLFAAWSYQAPLDDVIRALKFGDLAYLGGHLGDALAESLPTDLTVDAVVPVPLHWRRSWSRGYNQAAEIARALAGARDWPLRSVLRRRRPTPPQSGLDRTSRRRNLRWAFAVQRKATRSALRAQRLLLIDDVYTTGATAEAAARALKKAGVRWVGLAVAGRTPRFRG